MKIIALKTGRFAHPEPCKPMITITTGDVVDVDERMALALIDTAWGIPYLESTPVPEPTTTIVLSDMTKKELEDYADSVGLADLNPRLTKAEMIAAIEAHNE